MGTYTTPAVVRETTTFDLDGETFAFAFPKTSALVLAIASATDNAGRFLIMLEWLESGLEPGQRDRLRTRLADPDDGLDISLVTEIARDLIAEAADRPTG